MSLDRVGIALAGLVALVWVGGNLVHDALTGPPDGPAPTTTVHVPPTAVHNREDPSEECFQHLAFQNREYNPRISSGDFYPLVDVDRAELSKCIETARTTGYMPLNDLQQQQAENVITATRASETVPYARQCHLHLDGASAYMEPSASSYAWFVKNEPAYAFHIATDAEVAACVQQIKTTGYLPFSAAELDSAS